MTWRTRLAMALSLLAGAGVVAAALAAPGLPAVSVADPAPSVVTADPGEAAAASAQSELVELEDARLLAQLRAVPWNVGPYLDRENGTPALILTAGRGPYDLESLIALGAAIRVDAATVDLTTSVLVAPGAQLVLDAPGTTLRMTSSAAGFTTVVGWQGSLSLAGDPGRPLTVRSWDPAAAGADRTVGDGRAYLRVVDGELRTADAALLDLGFWSGRTGGLALTGNDGTPATGSISATLVRGGHYGLFSEDSENLTVDGSDFDDSAADGIRLHRGSTGVTITSSTARGNGGHGVVSGRGASAITVRSVVAEFNRGDGIRINGRPLAAEPGPAGLSLDGHAGFRVLESTSRSNLGTGILIWDADDVQVTGNAVTADAEGIVVRGAAEGVRVAGNIVTGSTGVGIAVRDGGTGVEVARNAIVGATTGVQARDAVVEVRDNRVRGAAVHGLSFQGAANGSSAMRNTLAGEGSSSIDVRRLDPGATIGLAGNADGEWQVVRTTRQRVADLLSSSPLLVLWALLFLAPVVATVFTRRRSRPTTPYPARTGSPAGRRPRPSRPHDPAPTMRSAESDTRVTVVGSR